VTPIKGKDDKSLDIHISPRNTKIIPMRTNVLRILVSSGIRPSSKYILIPSTSTNAAR
jgi:hypothetical protein